ncbi:hypothetical protein G4B88_017843 [Cannabis sativa]|uniref:Uncharacterized protein n=1 Tax=Cannabis sativa TaxID=3483 RepID=A0A7J6GQ50_CANSA|nr:hypothetical protein G4B88_017843 [Cannabis sativa]
MADSAVSLDKVKGFLYAQYNDEEKWALNMIGVFGVQNTLLKLLRAVVVLFVIWIVDLEIPFKDRVFCLVSSFSKEEEGRPWLLMKSAIKTFALVFVGVHHFKSTHVGMRSSSGERLYSARVILRCSTSLVHPSNIASCLPKINKNLDLVSNSGEEGHEQI